MSILNVSASLKIRSDADPSVVRLFVSEARTVQYFSVALTTVLVYHSVITMDKEIKYFWPNPCSSVNIVYFASTFLQRALEDDHLLSCLFSYWTGGLADLVIVVLIDYILLIRVLALWHQDKKLSITLKILLGLEAGLDLGLLVYGTLFQDIAVGSLAGGLTICARNRAPPRAIIIVTWLTPMTYGSILLCLALYKATEYWKLSSGFKGFHLVRVLIQDQVLYYGFVIFCFVCQIVEASIDEISPFVAYLLSAAGSPILLCVLGGQLLINLKEAGERGVNGGTNYTPTSVSDIDFGENGAIEEQTSGQEGSLRCTEIELHSFRS
ncbi:hypothetical protein ACEPAI_3090 [Sanghuangporus weigelae]